MCAGAAPGQTDLRLVCPVASGPFLLASCVPYTKHTRTQSVRLKHADEKGSR